jgi:hypothetical protein
MIVMPKPNNAKKVTRGERVYRCLERIENGPTHTTFDPRTGLPTGRTFAEGEKASYGPGDIVPESIVAQIRKIKIVDGGEVDLNLDVLYEESIAGEDEILASNIEAEKASTAPKAPAAASEKGK